MYPVSSMKFAASRGVCVPTSLNAHLSFLNSYDILPKKLKAYIRYVCCSLDNKL